MSLYRQQWYHKNPRGLRLKDDEMGFSGNKELYRDFHIKHPELSHMMREGDADTHPKPSDNSVGLWKDMQLTFPPIRDLRVKAPNIRRFNTLTKVCEDARVATFIDTCIAACKETGFPRVINHGAEEWVAAPGAVDQLTGFDMLAIMEAAFKAPETQQTQRERARTRHERVS